MRRLIFTITVLIVIGALSLALYTASGWWAAAQDAPDLKERAAALLEVERGPDALGEGRFAILLEIQDPRFYTHKGRDGQTPGAGVTTLTQSLSKRVGFEDFKPGLQKLRQTAYALSLERHLTKTEIAALWLDTLPMGYVEGEWTIGFFDASDAIYRALPAALSEDEFLTLIAVIIAPGRLSAERPDAQTQERIARIKRKLAGDCAPANVNDVWLEACAIPRAKPPT